MSSTFFRSLKLGRIFSTFLRSHLARIRRYSLEKQQKSVNINFIDRDGEEIRVKARIGDNLLEVAHANDIDLEGACEGTVACSTCHLVIDEKFYNKIDEPPSEEELDMLDLAFGLTDTSRLGCQVIVSEKLDNMTACIPSEHRDMRNE